MPTSSTDDPPRPLRFTVHGDGSSDRVLLPIVRWVLRQVDADTAWESQWADLSRVQPRPHGLNAKLQKSIELYACDVLFVHRDQENGTRQERIAEIATAATGLGIPIVPIVPVRMTEAWLLFDERALRKAAGNPRGTMPLALPELDALEEVIDPKEVLFEALRRASGLSGRRLEKLRPQQRRHQLAELIEDFAPLRRLSAFGSLIEDTRTVIGRLPRL